jgi:hypothetical protein
MAETTGANFDRETVAFLRRILVEAEATIPIESRSSEIRVQLASGILMAAAEGERDPVQLRSAGLRRIDHRLVAIGATWLD